MASSEERMMILRMVEEGKITPEEGARLLAAMGEREAAAEPVGAGEPPGAAAGAASGFPGGGACGHERSDRHGGEAAIRQGARFGIGIAEAGLAIMGKFATSVAIGNLAVGRVGDPGGARPRDLGGRQADRRPAAGGPWRGR